MGLTHEQQAALDLHNKTRREAPGGSRPDLVWSETLAKGATAHARRMAEMGKQQHDIENVQRTGQGENLAWGIDGVIRYQPQNISFQGFNFPGFAFPMATAMGLPSQQQQQPQNWPPAGSNVGQNAGSQGQNPENQGQQQDPAWPPAGSKAQQPKSQAANAGGRGGVSASGGMSLKDASKLWADEKKDYNGDPIKDGQSTGQQGETGHYTQMVWPEVTKMGIGKFTVPPGDKRFKGRGTYVCARYDVCQIRGYSAWRSAFGNNAPPRFTNQREQSYASKPKSGAHGSMKVARQPSSSSSKSPGSLSTNLDVENAMKKLGNNPQRILDVGSSKLSNPSYTLTRLPTGYIETVEQRNTRKDTEGKLDFDKYGKNLPDWIKQLGKDPNKPVKQPDWVNEIVQGRTPHKPKHELPPGFQDAGDMVEKLLEKNKQKRDEETKRKQGFRRR